MPEGRIDFFISHSSADSAYAVWVDSIVRSSGRSTITDVFDFRPGDNFVRKMSEATSRSERILLLWSQHAATRDAVELEWTSFLTKAPGKVIPILLDHSELPAILKSVLHIDLADVEDDSEATRRLLSGIHGKTRPATGAVFPRHTKTAVHEQQGEYLGLDTRFRPREDQASFTRLITEHSEFWLAAKGFEAFLHQYERVVRASLTSGAQFRFLMHDPGDVGLMSMMANLSYGNRDPARIAERLEEARRRIDGLITTFPESVQLRLTGWLIPTGYTFRDPESAEGSVYVEFFGYRLSLGERMSVLMDVRREPALFAHHLNAYKVQWAHARQG